jgi:AraC family transcriptional regulator
MSNIPAMIQAVEFIEDNLTEDIAVADVADAVSYSLYHFCRMFNSVIHHTPYDYLMRRRLSESARELVETNKKIIEIAFDYQFNSPETYSRAFKRMFSVQPYQWRKRESIDRRSLMSRLTAEHIQHMNKGDHK